MKEQKYIAELIKILEELPQKEREVFIASIPATFKSGTVSVLLGAFLGFYGGDRFYNGQWVLGILKLVTLGGLYVWFVYDLFTMARVMRSRNLELAKDFVINARAQTRPEEQSSESAYAEEEEYQEIIKNQPDEREALLETLTDIPQMSDQKSRALLDQYPDEWSIQSATIEQLSDIPGIGKSIATAIKARLD